MARVPFVVTRMQISETAPLSLHKASLLEGQFRFFKLTLLPSS